MNIAVFASGNGSDLQAIMDACANGRLAANVCCVISNNSNAFALERARSAGIPAYHISTRTAPDPGAEMINTLRHHHTGLVFLAGYLKKLPSAVTKAYPTYNIHPALLPKFGGKGMYGIHVHTAVLAAGETETGITIHRVSDEYDTGAIVAQCTVPVLPGDTPDLLAARVLTQEHVFIVDVLEKILCEISSG